MNAHITDPTAITDFLLAGRAVFTLKSKKTDRHYTYKVSRLKKHVPVLWFVNLMTGPDTFVYIGILEKRNPMKPDVAVFRTTGKTKNPDAPSVKGFDWFSQQVFGEGARLDQVECWHEGRCGRCSRPLTDPQSIASGIGPICRTKGI